MTMTLILADATAVTTLAASHFAGSLQAAVEARGRFVVLLSGGSTPKALYEMLATETYATLPWDQVVVCFEDERDVPADHAESNYRMAHEALLAHVPIPAANVHRIPTDVTPPKEAAATYEKTLRSLFDSEWPQFDLALMGVGEDGHTASLFPGSPGVDEKQAWVIAPFVDKLKVRRYSLTLPALANAREMVFLAVGPGKAEAVSACLEGAEDATVKPPARRVSEAHGRAVWLLDKAAGRKLKET